MLPPTVARGAAPSQPDPTRDITSIIGDQTNPADVRGTLYIRDLFCNGSAQLAFLPASSVTGWDQSPHDFRLSPGTAPSGDPRHDPGSGAAPGGALAGGGIAALMLVDNGWSGPFPVTFDNGRVLQHPPGYLLLEGVHQATWGFSAWDHDCEGYGNPRIIDHPAYVNGSSAIDIGADELGINIIAGYRYGTTMFVDVQDGTNGLSAMHNNYQWFLGAPPAQAAVSPTNPSLLLPVHRRIGHLTPPPPNYDYTAGGVNESLTWWGSWSFSPTLPGSFPYYRPTVADITPHLLIDPHPWWQNNPSTAGFSCNPIWQYCQPTVYNASLYIDPLAPVANPPGTYRPAQGPVPLFEWLDESGSFPAPIAYFGQKGVAGARDYGGPVSFTVSAPGDTGFDAWCRGFETTTGTPPVTYDVNTFPSTNSQQGMSLVRFSVENFIDINNSVGWGNDPSIRNVESFSILVQ